MAALIGFHLFHLRSISSPCPPSRHPLRLTPQKLLFSTDPRRRGERMLQPMYRSMSCCRASRRADSNNGEQLTASTENADRPSFDLNLAVVLAGFAFEAYTSPPKDVGKREVDADDCQTVFLSEQFLREIYDGQLFIKLKKGLEFPAMDPWGTSDPYVVLQLEGHVKSNIKWATKEPIWNEELTLNINKTSATLLQVTAWDANLVTPHKHMGNAAIDLASLCDGNSHDLVVELEGVGGGGKIHLQIQYKSFEKIDEERQWWKIPFVSDFFMQNNLQNVLKSAFAAESINVSKFVKFAFGVQISSFYSVPVHDILLSERNSEKPVMSSVRSDRIVDEGLPKEIIEERSNRSRGNDNLIENKYSDNQANASEGKNSNETSSQSNEYFWSNLASSISQTFIQKLGFSVLETVKWDELDFLNRASSLFQRSAEDEYIQSGLATPEQKHDAVVVEGLGEGSADSSGLYSPLTDIKKASRNILGQTESILGALMVLTMVFSQDKKVETVGIENDDQNATSSKEQDDAIYSAHETGGDISVKSELDETRAKDMKQLFSTAESAMEAWAMLATSLGQNSFIKSEFEKLCFLDNDTTDTQVAIWRDSLRRRLVVAFRGTEQVKWKDLRTDLMLIPSGLNPERLGGDFKEEVQVHSGFLHAYDSVRDRIMTLIKRSILSPESDESVNFERWHVYATGHSLGGALATLLALELSSSRMAKTGLIDVTMYNFGSPRVGNRRFAEVYNEKVKDSWRIVNHRDIIPTVPRLMGYCHVAQPVYLAAGDLKNALTNLERLEDGYQADVIGECTPDVLVNEFMKGEKQLIEKILQTEIDLFRSIRDGTALMQHMEDFYYITLLESVRSNYVTNGRSDANIGN